ncbi:hypothetical protein CVT25_006584 [Psilocybe cyanescens]|uniref:Uncharacterized protein n=1 Tax=Psilocybe cyanescens TaxID=93625 RepID=A0A409X414_PSICY|nr:hypothetical protein CVT25_006584 [Psilocybe cyanescens]
MGASSDSYAHRNDQDPSFGYLRPSNVSQDPRDADRHRESILSLLDSDVLPIRGFPPYISTQARIPFPPSISTNPSNVATLIGTGVPTLMPSSQVLQPPLNNNSHSAGQSSSTQSNNRVSRGVSPFLFTDSAQLGVRGALALLTPQGAPSMEPISEERRSQKRRNKDRDVDRGQIAPERSGEARSLTRSRGGQIYGVGGVAPVPMCQDDGDGDDEDEDDEKNGPTDRLYVGLEYRRKSNTSQTRGLEGGPQTSTAIIKQSHRTGSESHRNRRLHDPVANNNDSYLTSGDPELTPRPRRQPQPHMTNTNISTNANSSNQPVPLSPSQIGPMPLTPPFLNESVSSRAPTPQAQDQYQARAQERSPPLRNVLQIYDGIVNYPSDDRPLREVRHPRVVPPDELLPVHAPAMNTRAREQDAEVLPRSNSHTHRRLRVPANTTNERARTQEVVSSMHQRASAPINSRERAHAMLCTQHRVPGAGEPEVEVLQSSRSAHERLRAPTLNERASARDEIPSALQHASIPRSTRERMLEVASSTHRHVPGEREQEAEGLLSTTSAHERLPVPTNINERSSTREVVSSMPQHARAPMNPQYRTLEVVPSTHCRVPRAREQEAEMLPSGTHAHQRRRAPTDINERSRAREVAPSIHQRANAPMNPPGRTPAVIPSAPRRVHAPTANPQARPSGYSLSPPPPYHAVDPNPVPALRTSQTHPPNRSLPSNIYFNTNRIPQSYYLPRSTGAFGNGRPYTGAISTGATNSVPPVHPNMSMNRWEAPFQRSYQSPPYPPYSYGLAAWQWRQGQYYQTRGIYGHGPGLSANYGGTWPANINANDDGATAPSEENFTSFMGSN